MFVKLLCFFFAKCSCVFSLHPYERDVCLPPFAPDVNHEIRLKISELTGSGICILYIHDFCHTAFLLNSKRYLTQRRRTKRQRKKILSLEITETQTQTKKKISFLKVDVLRIAVRSLENFPRMKYNNQNYCK